MFIAETKRLGFLNVFAHAEKQCKALPQTGSQVLKLWNQRLGLRTDFLRQTFADLR